MESVMLFLLLCITFSVSRARPLVPTAASDLEESSELAPKGFSSVHAPSPWSEDFAFEDGPATIGDMDEKVKKVKVKVKENVKEENDDEQANEASKKKGAAKGPSASTTKKKGAAKGPSASAAKKKEAAKGPSASATKKKAAAMAPGHNKGSSEN